MVCVTKAGTKQLVGYLVWRNGRVSDLDNVRSFLKETLPEYMVCRE